MAAIIVPLMLVVSSISNAQDKSKQVPVIESMNAKYPRNCKGVIPQQSGLCLLTSTKPKASTIWLLKTKDQSMPDQRFMDKRVTPNSFMPLVPGNYYLYSNDGFDSGGHELLFTVTSGSMKTIETAAFKASGKNFYIRHFQSKSGVNGAGCGMRNLNSKASDILPGNYLVYKGYPIISGISCPVGGVAVNALAGEVQQIGSRKQANQKLPQSSIYHHPDGVSSLTSISQFREDIHEIGLIPKWISYNGIVNPYRKKYHALVLSGVGTRTYIIPFILKRKKSGCGHSLAKAGLASMPLLTECKFAGGKLKAFKVQAGGSYYTLNNRHGVATIEGNNINNSIQVKELAVSIK